MTKFEIKNGKLFLKERTNKDELMFGSSYRSTDLRTEIKDVKKIFDNPVTAIAYDDETRQHNCEMDKISLLKALDFWINDKVLQNEKILFLEGNLKDVHEIELKKLIELREFVRSQPSSTVFTRFRGDEKTHSYSQKSSWTVEFFVKKKIDKTFIDPYNKNFRDDGARFNFNALWDATSITGYFRSLSNNIDDEVSIHMSGGRHDDPGTVISNTFSTATSHAAEALDDLTRELNRVGAGTDAENSPLQMGDTVVFDRVSNSFRRANINDSPIETILLSTERQTPEFLIWVLTRTFVIPENAHLMPGDMLSINNSEGNIIMVNAQVSEELHPGDIVTLVTLDGESRWRKVEGLGPDHLLHSNLHPGITAPSNNNNNNNRIQDITFENLTIYPVSETMEAGSNSYVMTTYAAQNGQYEMTFDLYITGREIYRINEGFRTHTMRILEEEGRIEIDGQRLYCASYTIRERIRNSGSDFIPRTFLDMYIDRTSMERSPPMYALGSDINRGPIQYKIHLTSQDHKTEIELTIRDRNNTINNVSQHIRSQPVNVGILDREVTLNGYSFPTIDFPEVTWSSR